MFQVEDSWTSLIGGLLAATRGLLKTRRDRSEPKMFDEDDVELSDEYADDDDRGSDDGTGIHTTNTSNSGFFLCTPEKNSRGQKLKKLKTQEKNSKLKPKPQFSGIFQKILQIVYFLKRRYNLS